MCGICDDEDDIKICSDEVGTAAVLLDTDTENRTVEPPLVVDMITELELCGAVESTER